MDIRRFFTPAGGSKAPNGTSSAKNDDTTSKKRKVTKEKASKLENRKRVAMIVESDSEEEPLPRKSPRKDNKRTSVLAPHSEDETFHKKKTVVRSSPRKQDLKKASTKPSALTPVSAEDFFDSGPVKPKKKMDKEIHSDKDFEKTLEELDKKKQKPNESSKKKESSTKKQTNSEKNSPKKVAKMDDSNLENQALANKLAKKIEKSYHIGTISKTNEGDEDNTKGKRKSSGSKNDSGKKTTPVKTVAKEKKMPSTEKPKVTPSKVVLEKITPEKTKKEPVEDGSAEKAALERRRSGFLNYKRFLEREPPKALGTKEIPEGAPNCLCKVNFVITGILETIERDDAKALIEKCGGKVMNNVGKTTNYVVAGRDPGPSKISKAEQAKITILNEDELFDMIRTRSDNAPTAIAVPKEKSKPKEAPKKEPSVSPTKKRKAEETITESQKKQKQSEKIEHVRLSDKSIKQEAGSSKRMSNSNQQEMWVDKYKPVSSKQIIGQQGDKSNVKKLIAWLTSWHKHHSGGKKPPPPTKWGGLADGSSFKAALLSGSPGIGKTTSAHLACKEACYECIEFNASDTRSKRSLKEEVAEFLSCKMLSSSGKNGASFSSKHVLIMDEVDGMSGNQDRGGIQELIALIKSSKIPIICICNDRSHPKIRSLVNYCFDLRFYRPQVKQIQAAMMSIVYKEGIDISPNVLQEIIVASNQDIRQVLHNLSLWTGREKSLSAEQAKTDTGFGGTKDIKLGPFDVIKKILSTAEGGKNMSLIDKASLFFHDYQMIPLFVQENYLHVTPTEAKGDIKKHLRLISETADSICQGDIIEKQLRSSGSWSLLPTQAIFSSVIPGDLMRGYLKEMISFPAWFGKNSTRNKYDRLMQELQMHTRTRISADKTQLLMDYLPTLRSSLSHPLITKESEGVKEVLNVMQSYYLQKQDIDNIMEVGTWSGKQDPMSQVSSKVKSALTRAFNKGNYLTPYAVEQKVTKKGRKGKGAAAKADSDEEEEEEIVEETPPDVHFVMD